MPRDIAGKAVGGAWIEEYTKDKRFHSVSRSLNAPGAQLNGVLGHGTVPQCRLCVYTNEQMVRQQ